MSVPQLRFKKFNGDWSLISLNQLSTKIGDGIHATPKYDENGTIPFINGNNLVNGRIVINENTKRISAEEFQKYNQILSDRTLFLSINGTIGNLAFYKNEKVLLGKSVCFINLKNHIDKKFIYLLLQSPQLTKTFNSELTGTTIKNLSLATVRNSEFYCPIEEEQTKIASFLSAVDEKISQLNQKHQLLSQYKQGMMQKLFSQQIRFKADDGSEFGEWKSVFLGDISKPQQWKTISSSELTEIGYPVFGANGYIGFYPKYNHINETIAVTCRGATCGEVTLVKAKSYITGNAMSIDEINENEHSTLYIYYALCFRGFKDVISGSAQPQIVGNAIRKVTFQIPCLEEQTKIANFLSAIDQKIEVVAQQIEQAKTWKKGLLQQMFV